MAEQHRTLLAVHAHPDDETITMGGTLARYSAQGVRTVVVMCTTGDLGEIRLRDRGDQSVAAIRDSELEAAAKQLGINRLVQLGYSDSGMAGVPENQRAGAFFMADISLASQKIKSVIEEERPQVMVAYDQTGGYGHPDHIKVYQVAVAAFCACDESIRPQKLYFVRFPLSWSREFVRALREAGIDAPGSAPSGADAGPDIVEIGVPDDLVTTAMDVRAYVSARLSAIACYPSQMPPDHFLRQMPEALAQRLWAYEFFSREVPRSETKEADLFAGIE